MAGFFAVLIFTAVGLAAAMPSWLAPYPGAAEKRTGSAALAESSYTAQATQDQIAAHYRGLFAAAGLPFQANSDGIGLSARVAAPECDLVIQIREAPSAGAASVRITCAVRAAGAAPTAPGEIQVTKGSVVGGSSQRRQAAFEQKQREFKEHHDRVMAQADADAKQRRDSMAKFDSPVRAGSIATSGSGKSFYNDDAPPLAWPSWLVQKGTNLPPRPTRGTATGKPYLESRYQTNIPMTQLHSFYEDLLNSNGYKVYSARLATGQTISGRMVQNKSGSVEGSQSSDGSVNGPHTTIVASYDRSVLNGPITVSLRVTVSGSFGRR